MFQRIRNTLAREVGSDDVLLVLGVGLVTAGLWPLIHALALMVPGVVALWIGLPTRPPFFDRSAAPDTPKRRQS